MVDLICHSYACVVPLLLNAKQRDASLSLGNSGESLICIIFYIPDSQKEQEIRI